ncbi:MAG: baseplate J/gp47 family protein [Oscillibacter sp.]|nr:baseplate J/gp47 family protein [Oscillibacter sp.]
MNSPILDGRDLNAVRGQVERLARSYTPEWRCEWADDDPGAAIAELFSAMFYQTVDRMNAVPGKLYTEFLNQTGFLEPEPSPARGVMRFTPSDTIEEPVLVRAGTRVFTPDSDGENVVYETEQTIQATPAQLLDVWRANGAEDSIRRSDSFPMRFFAPDGEERQRRRFLLAHNEAFRTSGPCVVTIQFQPSARYLEEESLKSLAELSWSFLHDGKWTPFDESRAEGNQIRLENKKGLSMDADENGRYCVACEGRPDLTLILDGAEVTSEPTAPCPAERAFSDDLPIPAEGGMCFGRRPSPYNLLYLRSDAALSKKGATVNLRLDIGVIVEEPPEVAPVFDYTRPIIDRTEAVVAKPDDAFVNGVLWEYFNGLGWRELRAAGNRNPFAGMRDGEFQLVFEVPGDIEPVAVNAETGLYVRARVTDIEHQFSPYQRWLLPRLREASFSWRYPNGVRAQWAAAENNGEFREIPGADTVTQWGLTAFRPLEMEGMYLRFDRSPHAYPLSLRFRMIGRRPPEGRILWQAWNGKTFEDVRCLDGTDNLLHTGEAFLFLSRPLREASFFGASGYWLRLSRTSGKAAQFPVVAGITTNAVGAVQRQREPEQFFDTGVYEAGKGLALLSAPVQSCEVWVDEAGSRPESELLDLERERPDAVRVERENHILQHCWVRWERFEDLALAGPEARAYALDAYEGFIRFGDGRQGRVPPAGDHNIRVSYTSGGGLRGNVPENTVRSLLEGLPRISDVTNITAMSGGTGRMTREELEERGNRRLRTRDRASGRRDFEDIVRQGFPQVRHARCFSGRDGRGNPAPGHVTLVFTGFARPGEDMEALSHEVYEYLARRCSCCLTAEGRLHVRAATVLTVNTEVSADVDRSDDAADTQIEIANRLENLIDKVWRSRPVGEQIRLSEIWNAVRQTPNVRLIRRILVEGAYDRDGQPMLAPLERDGGFPYAVVRSGSHQVRIE